MLFTTIKTKFAALLRRPSVVKAAFCVALAATVLKVLPTFLQFVGCDGTMVLSIVQRAYDACSLSAAFTVAALLSLSVLWAVLGRMFPQADRLMRYAALALALLLVVHALWIVVEAAFIPSAAAFAPGDTSTKVSAVVTALVGNLQELVQLAAALLLVVRYRGRLRQLGALLVAQTALACLVALAALAMQALHAGMVAAVMLSAIYFLCHAAFDVLTPVMLWRAVKG